MGAISTTQGRQSKLLGLGVHRPERVVTNDEICEFIDSSDEWIQTRSGIKNRRFTEPRQNVVYMSIEAGRKALEASGVSADQIDTVIVATSTHLEQTPQAAAKVAHALGTNGPAAFDIGAGCAGFCYALTVASDLVKAGTSKYVLVIGAEQLSETTDPYDRTTRFIFADGAGAVVVGQSDETEIGPAVWGSDGSQADAIYQTIDWYDFIKTEGAERPWIKMNGISVFRWAAFEMGKAAQKVLDVAGIKADELHAFVPHQANSRITELLAKSLNLNDETPVANDIAETGNTSPPRSHWPWKNSCAPARRSKATPHCCSPSAQACPTPDRSSSSPSCSPYRGCARFSLAIRAQPRTRRRECSLRNDPETCSGSVGLRACRSHRCPKMPSHC